MIMDLPAYYVHCHEARPCPAQGAQPGPRPVSGTQRYNDRRRRGTRPRPCPPGWEPGPDWEVGEPARPGGRSRPGRSSWRPRPTWTAAPTGWWAPDRRSAGSRSDPRAACSRTRRPPRERAGPWALSAPGPGRAKGAHLRGTSRRALPGSASIPRPDLPGLEALCRPRGRRALAPCCWLCLGLPKRSRCRKWDHRGRPTEWFIYLVSIVLIIQVSRVNTHTRPLSMQLSLWPRGRVSGRREPRSDHLDRESGCREPISGVPRRTAARWLINDIELVTIVQKP